MLQESIFYVFGTLGLVWCATWWWVARDSPEEDREGLRQNVIFYVPLVCNFVLVCTGWFICSKKLVG